VLGGSPGRGIGSGVSGMSGSGFVGGGTSLGGVSVDMGDAVDGFGMATSSGTGVPRGAERQTDEVMSPMRSSKERDRPWMP
jgi:hypothetical protein